MFIENEVAVDANPGELFALINDVERVAACMPGAELLGSEGDGAYRGQIKVKVGPIRATFEGVLRFVEVDEQARTVRLVGRGADTRGNGDAEVEVTVTVHENGAGSRLQLTTDLMVRGKFAQFGRGAIGTVSNTILKQFAANMGGLLQAQIPGPVPAQPFASGDKQTTGAAVARMSAPTPPAAVTHLDGLAALLGTQARERLKLAAAFVAGCVQGWLICRAFRRR
jgi:hypothetical protein